MLRDRASTDFWAFCEYVMRDEEDGSPLKLEPFHKKWCKDLQTETRMVVFSPINTGKSFIHTVANVLFRIGQNPNIRIGLISATAEMAEKFLLVIKQYIHHSDEYKEIFPGITPMPHPRQPSRDMQWTNDKIIVVRRSGIAGPTVLAAGIGVEFIGARFDYLILDDVLTMDNTESPTLLKRTIKWFDSTAKGRMSKPYSPIHVVGTAWKLDDLMHYLAAKSDWVVKKYSFEEEDKQRGHIHISWEQRIPREMLNRERAHNPVEYNRQRRCVASSEDEQHYAAYMEKGFQKDYNLKEVHKDWTKYMGVDLSGKKRKGTALNMIAVSPDGRMKVVIDVDVGAWLANEKADKIGAFYEIHRPAFVCIESNALQEDTVDWMAVAGYRSIPFKGFQTKEANKISGLHTLAIELRNDVWRFAAPEHSIDAIRGGTTCTCNWCRYILEVKEYPNYTSDDMVMSWMFANEVCKEQAETELNFHIIGVNEKSKEVKLLHCAFGFTDYYVGNDISKTNPNKFPMPKNAPDIVAHIKEEYRYTDYLKLKTKGVPRDKIFQVRDFAIVWLDMVYFCAVMNKTYKAERL